MKRFLKSAISESLAQANIFPTGLTNKNELTNFITNLHPFVTGDPFIRLGPKGDGGYLIPDDIDGIQACFSPGVDRVSDFEKDCADLGMQVFLADKSVEGPAIEHPSFDFIKKYIGAFSNDDFITLDHWVASSIAEQNTDLLLQMDIEGFEYEVFLSVSEALMKRFRIIVVEFHQLNQLWNWPFFKFAGRAFDKILQTHHCVHIHPNNCCKVTEHKGIVIPQVMEFTFLRNDRIGDCSYQKTFPNPLDYDNCSNSTITLPNNWYNNE